MFKRTLTIALLWSAQANAHCYTRWYYPTPQKCGGIYSRQSHRPSIVHHVNTNSPVPVDDFTIPLPDLNANWGGMLDTKLELELRLKALGYQPDR
jgi:hypothetical protein